MGFTLFSPCSPCCTGSVLLYHRYVFNGSGGFQTGASSTQLETFYRNLGASVDNPFGAGGTFTTTPPGSMGDLTNYQLIYLLESYVPTSGPTELKNWLLTGGKRLVLCARNASQNELITLYNSILATIGVADTFVKTLDGSSSIEQGIQPFEGINYLRSGLTYWVENNVNQIAAELSCPTPTGTHLAHADYWQLFPSNITATHPILSTSTIGSPHSEVVLIGNLDWVGRISTPSQWSPNLTFLDRLWSLPIQ